MSNKPMAESLLEDTGQSFLLRRIVRQKRPDHRAKGVWHYHPDYEITLTLKSSGKRFVGYSIDDYTSKELVLYGENLPHCWITNQFTEQYVITFKKEVLGPRFWDTPEFIGINKLLEKSQQGIKFNSVTTEKAASLILQMRELEGFRKMIVFFELLNLLALSEDIDLLTFHNFRLKNNLRASNRIEQVYSYIDRNFKNDNISITALSDDLHMTTSSLCKFIKTITKKTFTELLIDARIKEACKLLSETDKYISEICYLSGFNNLSGFNRAFKKVMHISPKEYRKIY